MSTSILLGLMACSSAPASIDAPQSLQVYDPGLIDIGAKALGSNGEPMDDVAVIGSSTSDAEIVRVGNSGELQCASNGTATVKLTAGPISRDIQITCTLIKALEVSPESIEGILVPGAEGQPAAVQRTPLQIRVIGLDDQPLSGVPTPTNSTDPGVASFEDGGQVVLHKRGKAELKVTAGNKAVSVPVVVMEEVMQTTDLVVKDGDGTGKPLQPGNYRIKVGSSTPVEVSVQGTECESDEAKEHELDCKVVSAGALRIENPGMLGMGDDARVKLRVLALP